jgi:hypothetical protein
MARVKNLDQITGSLKNLSFYTRKGSDQIFVRTKGGASKDKIMKSPAFENVRKTNKEFGGCSKMSKQIRLSFYGLEHVSDYNVSSVLCSLAKNIQKTDEQHEVGERGIYLSNYRNMLAGFDFGRTTRFASVLRVPLQWDIVREKQLGVVYIPAFSCAFGLNASVYGLFRMVAALGIVTDLELNSTKSGYEPVSPKLGQGFKTIATPWYSTQGSVPEQQLILDIKTAVTSVVTDNDTLVLTVVVEFGTPDAFGNPTPVRGAGAGMILGAK